MIPDTYLMSFTGHLPGVATPRGGRPVRLCIILEEAHLRSSYHIKLPFKCIHSHRKHLIGVHDVIARRSASECSHFGFPATSKMEIVNYTMST